MEKPPALKRLRRCCLIRWWRLKNETQSSSYSSLLSLAGSSVPEALGTPSVEGAGPPPPASRRASRGRRGQPCCSGWGECAVVARTGTHQGPKRRS